MCKDTDGEYGRTPLTGCCILEAISCQAARHHPVGMKAPVVAPAGWLVSDMLELLVPRPGSATRCVVLEVLAVPPGGRAGRAILDDADCAIAKPIVEVGCQHVVCETHEQSASLSSCLILGRGHELAT